MLLFAVLLLLIESPAVSPFLSMSGIMRSAKRMKTSSTENDDIQVRNAVPDENNFDMIPKKDGNLPIVLSYVEFYSGIGGWTMALEEGLKRLNLHDVPAPTAVSEDLSGELDEKQQQQQHDDGHERGRGTTTTTTTSTTYQLHRLAAMDHSDVCRLVFEHNFGSQSTTTIPIERLSLKQVESWGATIWAMSPPCQPHTRQHSNQQDDITDPRSKSFLHLIHLLHTMSNETLPKMILLENVIGFEVSASCEKWRTVLSERQYVVGHWHLSPTMVGLPNDRPRYYCVAILQQEHQQQQQPKQQGTHGAEKDQPADPLSDNNKNDDQTPAFLSLSNYVQMETNIDTTPPIIHSHLIELDVIPMDDDDNNASNVLREGIAPISTFLDPSSSAMAPAMSLPNPLRIPDKILQSSASWCFDIVTPHDQRSACFTHSYGKFVKGTGSILYETSPEEEKSLSSLSSSTTALQLKRPEERSFQSDWAKDLNTEKLRYFSPIELTRIFGFSSTFAFPSQSSLKQQWKVMGNSLNVRLSARLVEFGFRMILSQQQNPPSPSSSSSSPPPRQQ